MKKSTILLAAPFFLFGCATLKIKSHPDAINVCPYFPEKEDSLVTVSYRRALENERIKSPEFIKSVSCDSSHYPPLDLYYERTFIAGKNERIKAAALSAVGIGTPIVMISSGLPFFIFWWHNPVNQMGLTVDLADSLEVEDRKPKFSVSTIAWTGNRESQVKKQSEKSEKVLGYVLTQVKRKRGK